MSIVFESNDRPRLLYIAPFGERWLANNYKGVLNKIRDTEVAFENEGFSADVCFCKNREGVIDKVLRKIPFGSDGVEWPRKNICAQAVYIRKPIVASREFVRFLDALRAANPSSPILLEIPTYPYDGEFSGIPGKFALLKDRRWRRKLEGRVDRIVDLFGYEEVFGIKTVHARNGVNLQNLSPRVPRDVGNDIHLLWVSSFAEWHAVDRLLIGMGIYKRCGGDRKIILHLVGTGSAISSIRRTVASEGLVDNVCFHGAMARDEMGGLFDMCCFGVETLGDHRRGVRRSSSLKSREYLARGLPFLYSTPVDLFEDEEQLDCLQVPADDSAVDIFALVAHIDRIYGDASPQAVVRRVRAYAERNAGMDVALREVFDYIRGAL